MSENISPVVSSYLQARDNSNSKTINSPVTTKKPSVSNLQNLNPNQPLKDVYIPKNKSKTDWKPYIVMSGILAAGLVAVGVICNPIKYAASISRLSSKADSSALQGANHIKVQDLLANKNIKSLSELSGLEDVKDLVRVRRELFNHPEIANDYNVGGYTSMLLWGVPGTGKTSAAKGIAKEFGADFIEIVKTDFESAYVGEGAKRFKSMLTEIEEHAVKNKNKPVVIFMDEIDSVIATDTSSTASHSMELMNVLKLGMVNLQDKCKNVIFIGATNLDPNNVKSGNRALELDSAIMSRFKDIVQIDLPSKDAIRDAFAKMTRLKKSKLDRFNSTQCEHIASALNNLNASFRDVSSIVEKLNKLDAVDACQKNGKHSAKNLIDIMRKEEKLGMDRIDMGRGSLSPSIDKNAIINNLAKSLGVK